MFCGSPGAVQQQIGGFRHQDRRDGGKAVEDVERSRDPAHGGALRAASTGRNGARDADALGDEIVQEARPDPGRGVMPVHRPVRIRAGADVLEDLLHLDDVAFHAGDLGDAGHLALAVAEALQLHDDADGGGDLAADRHLASSAGRPCRSSARDARSPRADCWRGSSSWSLHGPCSWPGACRRPLRRGTRRR